MEKRYQVFVSSTYADLKSERQHVLQALMDLDCIPAGMEMFPASDQDQFEFIKKIIDDCDYYLLIVGGRYGSLTEEGVSFTEREFDYAVEKDIRVIAFLHSDPDSIPLGLSEKDPALREKLADFCEKVKTGRLVKLWSKAEELPGMVALSVSKTIKTFPAVGWVRANAIASSEILTEINELRKENAQFAKLIEAKPAIFEIPDLAGLDEPYTISGECHTSYGKRQWTAALSWRTIFAALSPYLTEFKASIKVKDTLKTYAFERSNFTGGTTATIDDQIFQTVSVQLRALGLVTVQSLKTTSGSMAQFWKLTPAGERLMVQLRAVRTQRHS